MSEEAGQDPPAENARTRDGGANQLRRRLLRGGIVGAPVVLSLASRSVMAYNTCTPSAYGSISASRPDVIVSVSGCPPSYWSQSQNYSQWPSPYHPTTVHGTGGHSATTYSSVFSPCPFPTTCTLLDALNLTGGCSDMVAQHAVAALLNAATGKTSAVLNVSATKSMWNEYATNGFFEPTAGVHWYAQTSSNGGSGIVGYLHTTWS